MGAMAEIAAEREDALSAARWTVAEALNDLLAFQDKHPIGKRSWAEWDEIERLNGVCYRANRALEEAKRNRFKVAIHAKV